MERKQLLGKSKKNTVLVILETGRFANVDSNVIIKCVSKAAQN